MEEINPGILVVDDDQEIRELVAEFLGKHHFRVFTAANTKQAQTILNTESVSLMVLDIMMPGEDGVSFCRRLRPTCSIPIIMLTAVEEELDMVLSLEVGADDYLIKPFNLRVLLARIKAILRRVSHGQSVEKVSHTQSARSGFEFSGWHLDTKKRILCAPDQVETILTTAEYELLLAFLRHPQCVLTREQLLDITRHREADPFDRSIDVLTSRLRQKIEEDPKNPQLIKTVRGGGYMFTSEIHEV